MRYATVWTSHLKNPEAKTAFLEALGHQYRSPQWLRLAQVLREKIASMESRRLTGYDSNNWAYVQADINGYHRALKEVLELLPLDQKE